MLVASLGDQVSCYTTVGGDVLLKGKCLSWLKNYIRLAFSRELVLKAKSKKCQQSTGISMKNTNACRKLISKFIKTHNGRIFTTANELVISMVSVPMLLLFALACSVSNSQAEIISFKLDANLSFKTQLNIQPGKFSEVCGKLKKGNLIRWQFDSSASLDFNIHYHEGKEVIFPYKMNAIKSAKEEFLISRDQDYCWMWTNKSSEAVKLEMNLRNVQAQ